MSLVMEKAEALRKKALENAESQAAEDSNLEAPPEASPDEVEPHEEGKKVSSSDPRRPDGEIEEVLPKQVCYRVKPAEGESYIAVHEELGEPSPEDEDEPMDENTAAPDDLAQALGLKPGATFAECAQAAKTQNAALKKESGEALTMALEKAMVKKDLEDLVVADVRAHKAKNNGTWSQAVEAVKAARPSAFTEFAETVAPQYVVPEVDEVASGGGESSTATIKPLPKETMGAPMESGAAQSDGVYTIDSGL